MVINHLLAAPSIRCKSRTRASSIARVMTQTLRIASPCMVKPHNLFAVEDKPAETENRQNHERSYQLPIFRGKRELSH